MVLGEQITSEVKSQLLNRHKKKSKYRWNEPAFELQIPIVINFLSNFLDKQYKSVPKCLTV